MLRFEFMFIVLCFCPLQMVQQDIVHSGVQSKADKSPVTVADYGKCRFCNVYISNCLHFLFGAEFSMLLLSRNLRLAA
jgi:hypothetical protein